MTASVSDVLSPWMSVAEVAAYARRHQQTVFNALWEYERSGGTKGLKGGQANGANSCWRIHRNDVDLWISGEMPKKPGRRTRAIA